MPNKLIRAQGTHQKSHGYSKTMDAKDVSLVNSGFFVEWDNNKGRRKSLARWDPYYFAQKAIEKGLGIGGQEL